MYRRQPIWDPRHRHHKDRNVIQKLWMEIGLELGFNDSRKQLIFTLLEYYDTFIGKNFLVYHTIDKPYINCPVYWYILYEKM